MERLKSYDIVHYNDGIYKKDNEYFYINTNKKISQIDKKRIINLHIPPNWKNIWINTKKNDKIQVIGIDEKNRKQYIYHKSHIEKAEHEKFIKLLDFVEKIPKLDKAINMHNYLSPFDKNKVIATMLLLVKLLHLRVGKEQYARENKSYGISSLKKKHFKIKNNLIKLKFKAKSKQNVTYNFYNDMIKQHLLKLLTLEGEKMFQYIDENNYIRKITDLDLNEYIKHYMGNKFSIKYFRTYAANFHFINALLSETRKRKPKNSRIIKKNILHSIKTTAHYLRHTNAISKKSYILKFIIDYYVENPNYFIERKNDNSTKILIDLLKKYKSRRF